MINFDVEPEFQEQIDWVEKFAKEEIEPLDLLEEFEDELE